MSHVTIWWSQWNWEDPLLSAYKILLAWDDKRHHRRDPRFCTLWSHQPNLPWSTGATPDDSMQCPKWCCTTWNANLAYVYQQLSSGEPLLPEHLTEKMYDKLAYSNHLEDNTGIVHYFKQSKLGRFRQLQLKVVPVSLLHTVIAACQLSPFHVHSGIKRTLYCLSTRFFCPRMTRDVTEGLTTA